jgi:arsenite methyltransferase
MPSLSLLYTFVRELAVSRSFPREPEPDLVMDDPTQVAAYAEAGRIDGVMAASYLFQSAHISQTIAGKQQVLDLGCGPATQLAQIAELNPKLQFTGVDLSPTMLADAKNHVGQLGLSNVGFLQADITRLDSIETASMDAVISTMALHHLPTLDHLKQCFEEIRRVLKPGGAVYLTDFCRLKSLKSVLFFAYMNAQHQPHLFSLDYERSLRAAFLREDFAAAGASTLASGIKLLSTFKVPLLTVIKTPDLPLDAAVQRKVKALRQGLRPCYRRDLNDMRIFFGLGGLRNDPF